MSISNRISIEKLLAYNRVRVYLVMYKDVIIEYENVYGKNKSKSKKDQSNLNLEGISIIAEHVITSLDTVPVTVSPTTVPIALSPDTVLITLSPDTVPIISSRSPRKTSFGTTMEYFPSNSYHAQKIQRIEREVFR